MNRPILSSLLAAALLGACVAPGARQFETSEAAAIEVVARVEAGDIPAAAQLYSDYGRWRGDPDALYPNLYDTSAELFELGDAAGAADLLALLADRHPSAVSVHEALVYALFVASAESSDPELGLRLDDAIARLRAIAPARPGWVDLAETQRRIDRGDLDGARRTLATFESGWTGTPQELTPYVQDLERYLATH